MSENLKKTHQENRPESKEKEIKSAEIEALSLSDVLEDMHKKGLAELKKIELPKESLEDLEEDEYDIYEDIHGVAENIVDAFDESIRRLEDDLKRETPDKKAAKNLYEEYQKYLENKYPESHRKDIADYQESLHGSKQDIPSIEEIANRQELDELEFIETIALNYNENMDSDTDRRLKGFQNKMSIGKEISNIFEPYNAQIEKKFNFEEQGEIREAVKPSSWKEVIRMREMTQDPLFILSPNLESLTWINDALEIKRAYDKQSKKTEIDIQQEEDKLRKYIADGALAEYPITYHPVIKKDFIDGITAYKYALEVRYGDTIDNSSEAGKTLQEIRHINETGLEKLSISKLESVYDKVKDLSAQIEMDRIMQQAKIMAPEQIEQKGRPENLTHKEETLIEQIIHLEDDLQITELKIEDIEKQIDSLNSGWFGIKKRLNAKKLNDLEQQRYKLIVVAEKQKNKVANLKLKRKRERNALPQENEKESKKNKNTKVKDDILADVEHLEKVLGKK